MLMQMTGNKKSTSSPHRAASTMDPAAVAPTKVPPTHDRYWTGAAQTSARVESTLHPASHDEGRVGQGGGVGARRHAVPVTSGAIANPIGS